MIRSSRARTPEQAAAAVSVRWSAVGRVRTALATLANEDPEYRAALAELRREAPEVIRVASRRLAEELPE